MNIIRKYFNSFILFLTWTIFGCLISIFGAGIMEFTLGWKVNMLSIALVLIPLFVILERNVEKDFYKKKARYGIYLFGMATLITIISFFTGAFLGGLLQHHIGMNHNAAMASSCYYIFVFMLFGFGYAINKYLKFPKWEKANE